MFPFYVAPLMKMLLIFLSSKRKKKGKQSCYGPGLAQRVPGS
jgi:hypothetical protein